MTLPLIQFNNFTCSHLNNEKSLKIEGTLELQQGDTVLLTGPSGGGKSTLLLILKGLIPQYIKANISIKKSYQLNLKNNESTYIHQNPYSSLITSDVFSEASFNLENEKVPQEVGLPVIKDLAQKLSIDYLLKNKRKVKNLSGGECQRLSILSALTVNPKLILLDEPTAFLDPATRRKFYQDLFEKKEDKTIVIADHHVEEVFPYIEKVWFCDEKGKVSEIPKSKVKQNSIPLSELSINHTPKEPVTDARIEFNLKNERKVLRNGDILFVTGENGAGKTTLLKEIAKNLTRDYSFTFQNPETHFFFDTVFEELSHEIDHPSKLNLGQWGNFIGLSPQDWEKSPFLLSEGEKRRLSLLLSFISNRPIHFMDEPTFGQDRESKVKIINKIIHDKLIQKIQVIVTHDDECLKLIKEAFPESFHHIILKRKNDLH